MKFLENTINFLNNWIDCAAKKCIQSKFTVATKIRQGGFDTAFNSFEVSEKKR